MRIRRNFRLQNELPEGGDPGGGGSGAPAGGDSSGGFDMDAAVADIASGLGFGEEKKSGPADSADGGVDDPGQRNTPTPSPSPSPAPSPAPSPGPTAAPAGTPAPSTKLGAPDLSKAPDTWTAAAKAKWENLDPELKAEVHRREQDIWKGLEGYRSEAQFAKSVRQALGPAFQMLQQANFPPEQFIQNLANTHLMLADQRVPVAQRREIALKALSQYGLDLTAQLGEGDDFIDPQVKGLQDRISQLESQLTTRAQTEANQVRQKLSQEIEEFATKNPLFYEVADDITILIRGSGGQMSLQDAFDRAIRANPVTFAKEQARIEAEAVAKAQKAEQERAEKARAAAAANVKTGVHQGRSGTAAATGSWDDTMAETLREIHKRG